MRLVAAGDLYWSFERTQRYLSELREGIVLFAEGSLSSEKHDRQDWTIADIARHTRDFPMTIIGERNNRIHIIKNGLVTRAQLTGEEYLDEQYREADQLHDVSYIPGREVLALSRICADAPTPYEGSGRADVLLIASGGVDWERRLEEVIEAHARSLKPNALIVQCDHHTGNRFIYSLRARRKVGKEITGEQGDKYIVHEI